LELITMSLRGPSRSAASRTQFVDAVVDVYVTWREESAAVSSMYDNWRYAPRDERSTAFDAYSAALDREERAARAYQRLLEQAAA
jgi:hypothetical protein